MEVLKFLDGHWSDILIGLSVIGGWFGIKRRAARLQAQWEQVRQWSEAAADFVVLWIQNQGDTGIPLDVPPLIEKWRKRLLEFAAAVGFDVSAGDMKKGLAVATARIGQAALKYNIVQLSLAAEKMLKHMNNGIVVPPITKAERAAKVSNPPPFGEKKP